MSAANVPAAMKAKAEAAPLFYYEGSIPSTPKYPYVISYFQTPVRSSDREADVRVSQTHDWYTVTVGISAGQASAAAQRLADAWEDYRPDVEGRSCTKVEHDSLAFREDDSLPDRKLYVVTDSWAVVSDPL